MMNKKTYYSRLFTSFSDPTMVANAFENYFRRVYERTIDKVGIIINSASEPASADNSIDYFTLTINDHNYVFEVNELKNKMTILNESDMTEINVDHIITLTDRVTNEEVSLLISDVSQAIGDCVDNAYVTWQGFRSLIDNADESANNFLTNVSIKMSNAYGGLKDSILNIFNTLHNSNISLLDKLNYLCEFTGLKQATDDPENIEYADIDLTNYTGINPVVGWLSGIDWKGAALTVLSIPILVTKFVSKCLVTVMKGIVGLFTKAFSWIGSWFKKTFIDPVDYKCDDSTLEFFKIPAKFCYALNPNAPADKAHDAKIIQWFANFGFDSELWLNDARVYRKITIDVSDINKPYLLEERYVSPISPEKLFGVLDQFMSPDDFVTRPNLDPDLKYFNGLRTIDEKLSLFSAMSNADLSIAAKTPEVEVYGGIFLSLYLNEQIDRERRQLKNIYENNVADLLNEQPNTFKNYDNEQYGNLYAVLYEHIKGQLITGGSVGLMFGNSSWYINKIFPSSVTNADFISMLTYSDAIYFTGSDRQFSVSQLSPYAKFSGSYLNVWDPDLITAENSGWNMVVNGITRSIAPWWTYSILVLLYSRIIHNGDNYDGAFVPYLDHAPNFKKNIDIITDQQHQLAIENFVKGAAITTAIVAATVIGGVVVFRALKNFKKLTLQASSLGFAYGEAIRSGDVTGAESIYKEYKSKSLKAKLLGLCLGRSSDLAGASIDGLNISLNGNNANDQILAVILPKSTK